ncbi:MAG: DMT family transporter [Thiotrichaceae bacterium]
MRNPLLIAITLTITAASILAGMDSLGKILMQSFPLAQVAWGRFFFHAVFVIVIFGLQGHRDFLIPKAPKIQLLRGLCILGVTTSLYLSIQSISLAEATAFLYLSPVIITLLSGLFLGEVIRPAHLLSVVLGFIGVVVITKPGFQSFEPRMVFAFLSAFLLALYFLLTSKVAGIDHTRTSLFYTSVVSVVVLTLLLPIWWKTPNHTQWLLLVSMGALGAMGHFLLIKAYSLVPASVLSPYLYAQVIAATIYSLLVFNDELEWNFFVGSGFIIGAGVFLWGYKRTVAEK